MITVDAATQQAIESTQRQIWAQVIITRRSDNSQIDITDACEEITISPDYEARSTTASITINNTNWQYSPADQSLPINQGGGTYDPLLFPMNYVSIYTNIATPSGTSQIQLFQGVLGDNIDTNSIPGQISVQCRDNSKRLQDIYIFLSPYYERMIAEDIISSMLQYYAPWVQFNVPVPSNYLIVTYNQASNTTLWSAIQSIADVMGWRLWFDETGVLQFMAIPTTATQADVVMDLTPHVMSAEKLSFSDANIRNDIWVKAESPYNGDILVAHAFNQESIDMFGDRYYEADRDITAYISTQSQAQQLANAICQRLSFLQSTDAVTMPLWPTLQVGDFVTVSNQYTGLNGNDYIFIVETLGHDLAATTKTTTVSLTSYTSLIVPSGTAPATPTNLTATITSRSSTIYAGSGLSGGNILVTYYPELTWELPSTDNLYGYTIWRAIAPSGTFYPAADFRAQDAQGNWITTWYDYFPVVGSGSYYITAYDFAGITSAPTATIDVVTPGPVTETILAPSGTNPSGTIAPPTNTGPALVFSSTETVWVPGVVTLTNSPPAQVSWQNGGTTVTVTGTTQGIGDGGGFQFWWEDPGGTWYSSGNYTTSTNTFSFTVNQEGVWNYVLYAKDIYGNEIWSQDYQVAGVGSLNLNAPSTASLGDTVTLTASSSGITAPEYQFWYQMPPCSFDPYSTDGVWYSSGEYSSSGTFSLNCNLAGTYTLQVYARSTQVPTNENAGQRALYEVGPVTLTLTVS